jgi:hypothetical protein
MSRGEVKGGNVEQAAAAQACWRTLLLPDKKRDLNKNGNLVQKFQNSRISIHFLEFSNSRCYVTKNMM